MHLSLSRFREDPLLNKYKQLTPQMGDRTAGILQQCTAKKESPLSKYTQTHYTGYSAPKHICVSVCLIL